MDQSSLGPCLIVPLLVQPSICHLPHATFQSPTSPLPQQFPKAGRFQLGAQSSAVKLSSNDLGVVSMVIWDYPWALPVVIHSDGTNYPRQGT